MLALLLVPASQAFADERGDFFEKHIRPVIVERCYECHSGQPGAKIKGGLRLDTAAGLRAGGENGPIVTAGDPGKSRLITAIRWTNDDLQMPPKKRLTDQAVASFELWVKQGAVDPRIDAAGTIAQDIAAARGRWPFAKPQAAVVPDVKDASWVKSDVDRFVLAKLEAKGLRPAQRADKRTLIRRATFDLSGLPPTDAEVQAFLADDSPGAFAKVVDRLLASPAYGQRWARHWLDVVRFTDVFDSRSIRDGGAGDVPFSWRYRDWVVDAFNRDLPYDEFIKQQIAGDLLPGPNGKPSPAGVIPTGVYMLGEWGGGDADKEKMLTDIVDDQIDVTGKAFLGLTLACARCHDHKFDPISQQDYYGLAGIFFSSHIVPEVGPKTAGTPVLKIPVTDEASEQRNRDAERRAAQLSRRLDEAMRKHIAAAAAEMLPKIDAYLVAAWEYARRPAGQKGVAMAQYAGERQMSGFALARWVEMIERKPAGRGNALSERVVAIAGNKAFNGWRNPGPSGTPNAVANSGDEPIRHLTFVIPPKSVAIHPSPTGGVAVLWTAPADAKIEVAGKVADADDKCGDGVEWRVGVRAATGLRVLSTGAIPNGGSAELPKASLSVAAGEAIELGILPKGEYSCDTTVVQLKINDDRGGAWDLSHDVSPDIHAIGKTGTPAAAWGFAETAIKVDPPIAPAGSALAAWLELARKPDAQIESIKQKAMQVREGLQRVPPVPSPAEVWPPLPRGEGWGEGGRRKARNRTGGTAVAHYSNAEINGDGQPNCKVLLAIGMASYEAADLDTARLLSDPAGPFWAAASKDISALPPAAQGEVVAIQKELTAAQKQAAEATPMAHGLQDGGTPKTGYAGFHDSPVMLRGRYDKLGDVVPRRFPLVLAGEQQSAITQGSGRLELARWIASKENPLTARVMVNRIWQHHFGEGIVRTTNNFGKLGAPATHPELLDWLAEQFVGARPSPAGFFENAKPGEDARAPRPAGDGRAPWSIKSMHRLIMLSAAYQQSSTADPATARADPENLLFARQNRQRLDSESLRDALLSAAGQLDDTLGGPAVADITSPRRTLYLRTVRSDRATYRMLFDAADPQLAVDKRTESTVAPQALFLLNSSFAKAQAKALAALAEQQSGDVRAKVDWLYRRLYARPPTADETELGVAAIGRWSGAKGTEAMEGYVHVLLCANEFMYVD